MIGGMVAGSNDHFAYLRSLLNMDNSLNLLTRITYGVGQMAICQPKVDYTSRQLALFKFVAAKRRLQK